jgi:tetratricopeptide (TPR) repeat protein
VRRGDYERAERIYGALTSMHPRDSQLLTALANVRRVHNDPWGAIEAYERAIEINPSYLPAQMGLADTQWARGDRDGAAKTYRRIADRFPESMVPSYVQQRAAP